MWKVGIEGGVPLQLTTVESARPEISPDGSSILCEYGEISEQSSPKIAVISSEGGEPEKMLDLPKIAASKKFTWSKDGSGVVFVDTDGNVSNLFEQPFNLSPLKTLTAFTSEKIFRFDYSFSNDRIVMARGHEGSDVVMISGIR